MTREHRKGISYNEDESANVGTYRGRRQHRRADRWRTACDQSADYAIVGAPASEMPLCRTCFGGQSDATD